MGPFIEARRSAGVGVSSASPVGFFLPRHAGVTTARCLLFGGRPPRANTPWNRTCEADTKQHVEVYRAAIGIEIQSTAEALNQCHSPGLSDLTRKSRLLAQVRAETPVGDTGPADGSMFEFEFEMNNAKVLDRKTGLRF